MVEGPAGLDIADILGGPADAQTLAETVAQRLRVLILEGKARPGTTLPLSLLAHSLGVSVMPIREALRRLEAEGLVVLSPRRVAAVADLSIEDAEEIYAMRVALEPLCARRGGERLDTADIEELERLFRKMEEADGASDRAAFIDCDRAFHSYLYSVSANERLIRMIAELQDRSRRYAPPLFRAWQTAESPLEAHRPMLAAIQARDPTALERLTREHMEQAADRLMRALVNEREERSPTQTPPRRRGTQPASRAEVRP